jgi:hypothetical protein
MRVRGRPFTLMSMATIGRDADHSRSVATFGPLGFVRREGCADAPVKERYQAKKRQHVGWGLRG